MKQAQRCAKLRAPEGLEIGRGFGKAGVESPRHKQHKERGREGQGTFQILTESWADVHNITLRR